MQLRIRYLSFSLLLLIIAGLLAACGATATKPAPAATATSAPIVATTTVAVATTSAPSATATKPTVAPTTVVAATNPTTATASGNSSLDPQKVEAGRKVFVAQCQSCHINGGKSSGGIGPSLALSRKALDAQKVNQMVRKGEDEMPAFDTSMVSDSELDNIIIYLKSIHIY